MTLPGSRTVAYGYDDAGHLTSLTDWASNETTFGYNDAGQRTSIERPNGVDTTYGYDDGGWLDSIVHADATTTLASFEYTLDAAGNRTSVETLDGTESYTYDALNRITSATYPNSDVIAYTYDAAGNRLTQSLNSVTTASYSYDDAGQMTSDGTTSYSYDDAGNLTDAGSNEFTWDWLGRMTSATVGSTTETYEYDGTGLRVSQTVDSTTTESLWDRLNSVPLLVDDGTYGYLHADGLLARVDGSDAADYYLTDVLGSVRGLTDGTGDVAATTSYDVFGEIQNQTGATDVFGFTGEQTDGITGFTYLRARYLDPVLGRFVSADITIPNANGSQGYNNYAYVANNPCSLVDPSGHEPYCPWALIVELIVTGAVLFAAGLVAFNIARLQWDIPGAKLAAEIMVGGLLSLMLGLALVGSCLVAIVHQAVSNWASQHGSNAESTNANTPSSTDDLTDANSGYPDTPQLP